MSKKWNLQYIVEVENNNDNVIIKILNNDDVNGLIQKFYDNDPNFTNKMVEKYNKELKKILNPFLIIAKPCKDEVIKVTNEITKMFKSRIEQLEQEAKLQNENKKN